MKQKSILERMNTEEKVCRVERGVYAIGMCVLPDHMVPAMRTALDEMQGMDFVDIPYSLAQSLHDTIELMIIKKKVRAGGVRLIVFSPDRKALLVSPLGKNVLKRLTPKLEGFGIVVRAQPPGLIV